MPAKSSVARDLFGASMWNFGRTLTKIGLLLKQILSRPQINISNPLRGGKRTTIKSKRRSRKKRLRNSESRWKDASVSRWKDLPEEILEMIFCRLDGRVLFETVYCVCQSWRSVSRPLVYFISNGCVSFKIFNGIGRGGAEEASQFMKLLKIVLDGLEGQSKAVTRIEFPNIVRLSDDHLLYLTKRVPNIKDLHLPYTTENITATAFSSAIKCFKNLQQLTMGPINSFNYIYVMSEIGRNLKNLNFLVLSGPHSGENMRAVRSGKSLVLNRYASRTLRNNTCNVGSLVLNRCFLYKSGLEALMTEPTSFHTIRIQGCKHLNSKKLPRFSSYILKKRVTEDQDTEWTVLDHFYDVYYALPAILFSLW